MALSFPRSRVGADSPASTVDPVPRNCVRRVPCVGGRSVEIVGYDAAGNPWVRLELSLMVGEDKLHSWERLLERESREMADTLADSRASLLSSALRLIKG
jgi:hypothetical protein